MLSTLVKLRVLLYFAFCVNPADADTCASWELFFSQHHRCDRCRERFHSRAGYACSSLQPESGTWKYSDQGSTPERCFAGHDGNRDTLHPRQLPRRGGQPAAHMVRGVRGSFACRSQLRRIARRRLETQWNTSDAPGPPRLLAVFVSVGAAAECRIIERRTIRLDRDNALHQLRPRVCHLPAEDAGLRMGEQSVFHEWCFERARLYPCRLAPEG